MPLKDTEMKSTKLEQGRPMTSEMTAHGFRATARTLPAERSCKPDAIERELARKASGRLGAAHDRA